VEFELSIPLPTTAQAISFPEKFQERESPAGIGRRAQQIADEGGQWAAGRCRPGDRLLSAEVVRSGKRRDLTCRA
jgi:hypothetical protein